jgi:hypothetical protein
VRVGDLVEALARVDERASTDAAGIVLDRLSDAVLFELRKEGDAPPISDAHHFPKDGGSFWRDGAEGFDGFGTARPGEAVRGVSGAWEYMRLAWCCGGANLQRFVAADRLAVLQAVAVAAFPELDWPAESRPTEASAAAMSSAAAPVVQPVGGVWPHVDGQAWTEAERDALFLMRHRDGWAGERLASVAGVRRQRIDELIGPARPHGGLGAARGTDGWAPSPALLAACGVPLQPLQSATLALTT